MCNIDFERIFAEWRTQRTLDYDKLNGLLSKATELAKNDEAIAILQEIAITIEIMADYDARRFLANGITRPVLTLKGRDATD